MQLTVLKFNNVRIAGEPWRNHKGFTIYEFFSYAPGRGNTKRSLRELKHRYGKLAVTDIGYPGDSSYSYWRYMLRKRFVDSVFDAKGREHRNAKHMAKNPRPQPTDRP